MFIATVVVSILLAAVLVMSARGKIRKDPSIVPTMETVRIPEDKLPALASLEIAGAVGLVVGLFWWPVGVAAAIGVVLYFVGAVLAHVRVKDFSGIGPSAVLAAVAVATLVLRLLSI
ncbi:DoxX family protein [Rhodococcus erythropolis]|uniref:DoxX family protein n=1 Tax=Rhodococcus erythropolis TaxID=1833 RepID=UPI00197FB3B2|nr:DoxX family protein [Rhodococcus erythropolis]QSE41306.1 DoxX family protein [Rhodococcus erythropolis]